MSVRAHRSSSVTATPSSLPGATFPKSSSPKLEAKIGGNKPTDNIQMSSVSKMRTSGNNNALVCVKPGAPLKVATPIDQFLCRPHPGQSATSRSALNYSTSSCTSRLTSDDPRSAVAVTPNSKRFSCSAYFRSTKSRVCPLQNSARQVHGRAGAELSHLTPRGKAKTHWITPFTAAAVVLPKPPTDADRQLSVGVAHESFPACKPFIDRVETSDEAPQKDRTENHGSTLVGCKPESDNSDGSESLTESDATRDAPLSCREPVRGSDDGDDGGRHKAQVTTIVLTKPSALQKRLCTGETKVSRMAQANAASFNDSTKVRSRVAATSSVILSAQGGVVRRKWSPPPLLRLAGSGIPIVRDVNADVLPSSKAMSASPRKYARGEEFILPAVAAARAIVSGTPEPSDGHTILSSGNAANHSLLCEYSSSSCYELLLSGAAELPNVSHDLTCGSVSQGVTETSGMSKANAENADERENRPCRALFSSSKSLPVNDGFYCLSSEASGEFGCSEQHCSVDQGASVVCQNPDMIATLSSDSDVRHLDVIPSKHQSALHSQKLRKSLFAERSIEQVTSVEEKSSQEVPRGETAAVPCASASSIVTNRTAAGDDQTARDDAAGNTVRIADVEHTADRNDATSLLAVTDTQVGDGSSFFPCGVVAQNCREQAVAQAITVSSRTATSFCHQVLTLQGAKWQVPSTNVDNIVCADNAQNLDGALFDVTRTMCGTDHAQKVSNDAAKLILRNQKGHTTIAEQMRATLADSASNKSRAALAKAASRCKELVPVSMVIANDAEPSTRLVATDKRRSFQVKSNVTLAREQAQSSLRSVEASFRSKFETATAVSLLTKRYRSWTPPAKLWIAGCSTPLLYRSAIACASA